MAILNDHKALILKERKSVDWKVIEREWKEYFDEAGIDNWRSLFASVIRGVMTDRAKALVTDFGFAFDVNNFYAREWFSDYTLQFAQPINDTTLTTLSNMLDQATNEGWSIPEMQNHMTTVFDQWMNGGVSPEEFQWYSERMPAYRTENIARTETIRASNKGAYELYKDNNVDEQEWVSTSDNRTRPEHLEANGQVRKLDEPFDVGGEKLMFPGDPAGSPGNTCQCRCTTVPVIKEIGDETPETTEPEPAYQFTEAQNIQEANDYAKNVLGIPDADYKGVDIKIANEWNKSLTDTFNKFPELKGNFDMVGSTQAVYKKEFDYLVNKRLTDAKNIFDRLGYSDAQRLDYAKKWAKKYATKTPPRTYAYSINKAKMNNGIFVNNKYTYKNAINYLESDVINKFHPIGCDSFKSVADHEIGHQIDDLLKIGKNDDINKIFIDSLRQGNVADSLSEYALKGKSEFVAEAWSEFVNNPNPRSIASQVGELILQVYKDTYGTR